MSDDAAVQFADPGAQQCRPGQPGFRVVDALDRVAVGGVDVDEGGGGAGKVGVGAFADDGRSGGRVGHQSSTGMR